MHLNMQYFPMDSVASTTAANGNVGIGAGLFLVASRLLHHPILNRAPNSNLANLVIYRVF